MPPLSDQETEKITGGDDKSALTWIQHYLVSIEGVEDFFQVINVVTFFRTLNKHVVM